MDFLTGLGESGSEGSSEAGGWLEIVGEEGVCVSEGGSGGMGGGVGGGL